MMLKKKNDTKTLFMLKNTFMKPQTNKNNLYLCGVILKIIFLP